MSSRPTSAQRNAPPTSASTVHRTRRPSGDGGRSWMRRIPGAKSRGSASDTGIQAALLAVISTFFSVNLPPFRSAQRRRSLLEGRERAQRLRLRPELRSSQHILRRSETDAGEGSVELPILVRQVAAERFGIARRDMGVEQAAHHLPVSERRVARAGVVVSLDQGAEIEYLHALVEQGIGRIRIESAHRVPDHLKVENRMIRGRGVPVLEREELVRAELDDEIG